MSAPCAFQALPPDPALNESVSPRNDDAPPSAASHTAVDDDIDMHSLLP